ncbi:fumarylacetoacetate hydrolase family protein [Paucibacter sp. DJ2R-2]|uniref:fumarylacetoacetate hydrolase family protein n=1 Tax=Paucibacter sp. DJ2R-2 TaxID=2893558 RepID=UPI0021E478A4|nr:fumarylacetoacetate hydrolase family protein [Paucibacter sp. DJ2R-2]MCV2421094.1 fumarylacetoacetate hydrolase family protein [Paucibacter sp. DJ4R-1]MCV2439072.1 fumarylacetoacetate hydrolase family protein [Paucibacter sp. DJ2R-2]
MKLATYQDGSRDGQLVLVSRDLSQAHYASGIATRLQQVLDDWGFLSPQLETLYTDLNHGRLRHAFNFEPKRCLAPLPRAYQWLEASAYLSHEALLRRARGAELPDGFLSEPCLSQGGSDDFLGACEPARFASEAMGIDFVAELAVVTGDVERGVSAGEALEGVRLLMLANGWCLRQLAPAEQARGGGSLHSKPSASFSPVAVTPDELGASWREGRVDLSLQTMWNGRKVGHCEAGAEMSFHFGQLIAQAAKTRRLRAGSIVGSGAVSKQDGSHGYSSIAEKRAIETLDSGAAKTEYMKFGDSIRIEMKGRDGLSLFGAIDQDLLSLDEAAE